MLPSKDCWEGAHPAGQGGPIANRYMVYLRITCLGIEKARRAKEQQNAVRRLDTIRRQLQEIEAETAALVRASRGGESNRHAQPRISRGSADRDGGSRPRGAKVRAGAGAPARGGE
jgi:hypothetical protein